MATATGQNVDVEVQPAALGPEKPCRSAYISTTDPSSCGRIRIGRERYGNLPSTSVTSSTPIPGPPGIAMNPPCCSDSPAASAAPSRSVLPSSSGVRDGYSWIAKFGMHAAICRHAAVETGDSGLCGTIHASCASAMAAIFFEQLVGQVRLHVVKENGGNFLLTNHPLP